MTYWYHWCDLRNSLRIRGFRFGYKDWRDKFFEELDNPSIKNINGVLALFHPILIVRTFISIQTREPSSSEIDSRTERGVRGVTFANLIGSGKLHISAIARSLVYATNRRRMTFAGTGVPVARLCEDSTTPRRNRDPVPSVKCAPRHLVRDTRRRSWQLSVHRLGWCICAKTPRQTAVAACVWARSSMKSGATSVTMRSAGEPAATDARRRDSVAVVVTLAAGECVANVTEARGWRCPDFWRSQAIRAERISSFFAAPITRGEGLPTAWNWSRLGKRNVSETTRSADEHGDGGNGSDGRETLR